MATLVFDEGPLAGERLEIGAADVRIGRSGDEILVWDKGEVRRIAISDPELSRRHAIFRAVDGQIEVEDLGSLNGTFVDGVRIVTPVRVSPGSRLELGNSQGHVQSTLSPPSVPSVPSVPSMVPVPLQVPVPPVPPVPSRGRLGRIVTGRRTRWAVVAAWLLMAVVFGGALGGKLPSVTSALAGSVDALPANSQSAQLASLVRRRFAGGQTYTTLLVYERATGLTSADRSTILADARAVGRIPNTAPATTAFTPGEPFDLLSANHQVAVTVIPLTARRSSVRDTTIARIRALVEPGTGGLKIALTGSAALLSDFNTAVSHADTGLLAATGVFVLLLLLLSYRSPLIAAVPLVVVGISYFIALGLIYVYAKLSGNTIDQSSLTLLAVLMFGAGTDYCLLFVARYTADLRHVAAEGDAVAGALSRTTHTILASGATVATAMLTFLVCRLPTDHLLAPVNAIGILVVMTAGITLLPALLGILGRRAFWPNRKAVAFRPAPPVTAVLDGDSALSQRPGLWFRLTTRVLRHPRVALACVLAFLCVGAVGLTSLHQEVSITQNFRIQTDSTRGLKLLGDGFPPGAIFPETVLIESDQGPLTSADIQTVRTRIQAVDGVTNITAPTGRSRDGRLVTLSVTYAGDPFSSRALARAAQLRAAVANPAPGLHGLVGNGTSSRLDYKNAIDHDTHLVVPIVLLLILLTLMILLRAVVAPLLLLGTVILSYLGTLGIATVVLGVAFNQHAFDPFFPLITFVFLVALGVDYNIFLMSRVREEAVEHGTRDGLLRALLATGPVITSAGVILAGTFAALTLLPLWLLLEIGLTVALGVLIDTFIVRTIAVPALVMIVGDRCWWPSGPGGGAAALTSSEGYRRASLVLQWPPPDESAERGQPPRSIV